MCTTAAALSKFSANCRVTADMDVRLTAGAAAAVLMWTGLGRAQILINTGNIPTIQVHVHDRTGLNPDVRKSAEQELTRIYALAGVQAVWQTILAEAPPRRDGVPTVTVLVLDAAATTRYVARTGLEDDRVLGAAARDAHRAYVFLPRVEFVARFRGRPLGTLLGAAVAHEVGHLLLPAGAHSNVGIMQIDLGLRSLMPARFTPAQAAAIAQRLRTWRLPDSK